MKQKIIISLLACCPLLIQAADIPVIVNQNRAANLQMCNDNKTADCINVRCMNSPDIRCTDNCKTQAAAQCKERTAE